MPRAGGESSFRGDNIVNTSSTTSTAASSTRSDTTTTRPRDDRQADDFARLLRQKQSGPDAERDEQPAEQMQAPAQNPLQHAHLPSSAPGHVKPPAEVAAANPMQRAASIDALAAAQSRMELAAPVDPAAARRFDVSIHEPAGLQLSMRVVQPADGGGRWGLSISSADLNPQLLRRNTGRLEERLRSRSLSSEPVRIEHEDES